jgi:glycosyltransferase involved in cell wall biosynthesis
LSGAGDNGRGAAISRAGPPRRILVAAYFYPPMNIIGARRPHGLAKWLRRRGHEVTVVTSRASGEAADDPSLSTVRTMDLLATRVNWRRRSREVVSGQRDGTWEPGAGIWGSIVVPDIQVVSWAPFAVAAARREHRRRPFDAVITTSPVESGHAVGLALSHRGVPWIADLRDGWRFEPARTPFPLRAQRAVDGLMERAVIRRADAVVTVSEPISRDLRRRYGVPAVTITNGFDPDDVEDAAPPPEGASPRKLTLVHTGRLGATQSLEPLLQALARLAAADASLHERIEVMLAGAQTAHERELYARPLFAPFIRHLGFISHEQAMGLQREADVLVLVTSGQRTSEATGKLFEYLAAARSILVLGTGTAAADIVASAGAGIAIPAHDANAAESALGALLASGPPPPPTAASEPYAYPALAEMYEQTIEEVITRHGLHRAATG